MTSAKADCIMRFICLMQERLLPTSGEPLLGIRSKRYNKFVELAAITDCVSTPELMKYPQSFRNRKSIYAKNIERFFLKNSKMNLQT